MPDTPEEERLAGILGDWFERRDRGEVVPPEEVIRAHPDLAEGLRARFEALGVLGEALRDGLPEGAPEVIGDFRIVREIGRGGMGVVYEAEQASMRRRVAMKLMKRELERREEQELRFVAEAQATSQLEHPGIPPIHEMGTTPEGAPWFTMKLVRGTTLREVLHNLLLNRQEFRQEYTLHRLVSILERICEAVHFAHEKGVLHRDLKPENAMLGDFGEVHVMDWGLARVRGEEVDPEDQVGTAGSDAGLRTLDGQVKGTAPYMSPEQAAGRVSRMDRRSDVWALGCLLYEILTLHLAFDGEGVLGRVRRGEVPPVRTRNPRRPVPEDLALLCEKCLRVDPAERLASAKELGASLRSWLDGTAERERRHREAQELAEEGREAMARYESLKTAVLEAERAAEAEAARFRPWQSVEEKAPALDARERVERMHEEVASAFAETTKYLEGALLAEPGNASARAALADLWAGRLADAERTRERRDTTHALRMVERYDDGRLAPLLKGDGDLRLRSDPPGAEVRLVRLDDRRGILVPGEERSLGRTPVGPVPLSMGSYLCLLRLPGRPEVRYPIHITRNRAWSGTVTMRTTEEVGEGFVFVPGGPFVYGDGRDTKTLELPDFAIQRFPVTFGDWAEFLRSVEEEKGAEEAAKWIPKPRGEDALMVRKAPGAYAVHASIVEGPARERSLRDYGADFEMRIPVLGVSWEDATEYCGWKTRTTGREWRLPKEEEREKAARGVDGRRFPWGDLEDATLGKCRDSREERSQPEPVGSFPTARSVYGMEDAAGNLWDLTDSWFRDEKEGTRAARGGSWSSPPIYLPCAFRYSYGPSFRVTFSGFRCARGLP